MVSILSSELAELRNLGLVTPENYEKLMAKVVEVRGEVQDVLELVEIDIDWSKFTLKKLGNVPRSLQLRAIFEVLRIYTLDAIKKYCANHFTAEAVFFSSLFNIIDDSSVGSFLFFMENLEDDFIHYILRILPAAGKGTIPTIMELKKFFGNDKDRFTAVVRASNLLSTNVFSRLLEINDQLNTLDDLAKAVDYLKVSPKGDLKEYMKSSLYR